MNGFNVFILIKEFLKYILTIGIISLSLVENKWDDA
jgi:hypothetical protein